MEYLSLFLCAGGDWGQADIGVHIWRPNANTVMAFPSPSAPRTNPQKCDCYAGKSGIHMYKTRAGIIQVHVILTCPKISGLFFYHHWFYVHCVSKHSHCILRLLNNWIFYSRIQLWWNRSPRILPDRAWQTTHWISLGSVTTGKSWQSIVYIVNQLL